MRRTTAVGLVCFLLGAAAGAGGLLAWKAAPRDDGPPPRWEATVYLPAANNPGADFTAADWDRAVARIAEEFGGFTLTAEVEGCWRDDAGRLVREKVRPLVVSFAPDQLEHFRRVIDEVGRLLKQEAVYVRYERPRVDLRELRKP